MQCVAQRLDLIKNRRPLNAETLGILRYWKALPVLVPHVKRISKRDAADTSLNRCTNAAKVEWWSPQMLDLSRWLPFSSLQPVLLAVPTARKVYRRDVVVSHYSGTRFNILLTLRELQY